MTKICVLGAGSFATALGCVLARNGHHVCLLARSSDIADTINNDHYNPRYFPEVSLPESLTATTEADQAFADSNYVLHAIPVQQSYEYLENLKGYFNDKLPIISCSKGLHAETLMYMSDIIPKAIGHSVPFAVLSGPSFAKELLDSQPSAVVVACKDKPLGKSIQQLFASSSLRIYTTTDVIGSEIGGALKNVFAIGAGMIQGMGYGYNSMAAFITRGCSEMRRLAIAMGAEPVTIAGLSGVGDLMLTCYGALSRNRSVGYRLGSGESLQEILDSMSEVAEGVHTTPAAVTLARKYQLDLPLIEAVADVLIGSLTPKQALIKLMSLPQTAEFAEETWQ